MRISTPKQQPVPKAQLLSYIIGLVMVVLFVYGLIRYPDLPIRECPSGYCGKQGQPPHSCRVLRFQRMANYTDDRLADWNSRHAFPSTREAKGQQMTPKTP